ncbi:hypothetical protein EXIGUO8H_20354 [Exiguobacterium sp. 8H]|uniref:hypothetical protein n=1 Tax=unclassified Exiguobacterium TaxID=2644629 RepID=UPI0012F26A61|nr:MULTISPECIES: hypothetical protein [unclassified Exiguobacterium]VXB52317.1 hypothetical protein EXIGUO8A_11423 [Exiguobacterium sp. 8A]VXB53053.1 hypothetical protein EXIGUO8H_20354 [Exiguobacterium sp. 8H]
MTLEQLKHRIALLPTHTQDEIVKAYTEMRDIATDYIDKSIDKMHALSTENIELIGENARLESKIKELESVIGIGWPAQLEGNKPYRLYLNGEYYGSGGFAYMVELMHEWVVVRDCYGASKVEFEIREAEKWRNQKT